MVEKASALPRVAPGVGIKKRMCSAADDLLTEELVPKSLRGDVTITVNSRGAPNIERGYLEEPKFCEYLAWVKSTPEIRESKKWDVTVPPDEYPIPGGTLPKMVEAAEGRLRALRIPKSVVLSHAVRIYRRMRGEPESKGLSFYIGRVLAREKPKPSDLRETADRLEKKIPKTVGRTLRRT